MNKIRSINRETLLLGLIALAVLTTQLCTEGCKKGVVETSYAGLAVTGDIASESMRVVMKLYKENIINDAEYSEAREIYKKYKVAYDISVEALASYKRVENEGTEANLIMAFEEMSSLASKLSTMLAEFQGRKEKP